MTEIARMYGGSLYDLAAEEGLETRILDELDEAAKLIRDDPEYLRLLSTPASPRKSAAPCWTRRSAGRSTSMC